MTQQTQQEESPEGSEGLCCTQRTGKRHQPAGRLAPKISQGDGHDSWAGLRACRAGSVDWREFEDSHTSSNNRIHSENVLLGHFVAACGDTNLVAIST